MDFSLLLKCERVAIDLAKRAGLIIQSNSGSSKAETKSSTIDFVTETDKAVEKFLFQNLQEAFPDHKMIGEESYSGKIQFTDCPTWIIDPIDGTTNFLHTFPFSCISIALCVNKEVILAIIYAPFLDRLYSAKKGCGSYCNGKPISVRKCSSLNEALGLAELGTRPTEQSRELFLSNLKNVYWKCHGLRATGSAALNCCMLAAGHADFYAEYGLYCWDMAAGSLIIREAGGCVIDNEGGEFNMMHRRILAASNEEIAITLSKLLLHSTFPHEC